MTANELIEILRPHGDATVCVEASWAELTDMVKVVFQSASEYCRRRDVIAIVVKEKEGAEGE